MKALIGISQVPFILFGFFYGAAESGFKAGKIVFYQLWIKV